MTLTCDDYLGDAELRTSNKDECCYHNKTSISEAHGSWLAIMAFIEGESGGCSPT